MNEVSFWSLFVGAGPSVAVLALCTITLLFVVRRSRSLREIRRIRVLANRGDIDRAVRRLEPFLATVRKRSRAAYLAEWTATDLWVTAGRYRRAVAGLRHVGRPRRLNTLDRHIYGIMQVNRAEALHNLGRDDLALRLLNRVDASVDLSPIATNGSRALRAWILAHLGRGDDARKVLSALDPRPLSPTYAAETHFTRSAMELCVGNLDAAKLEANRGLDCSVRASSQRNGLFLLGRIELARGKIERARRHYERGRSHRYRGQGGAALFELGSLYESLGEREAAVAVFREAIERDPESFAVQKCQQRLRAIAGA